MPTLPAVGTVLAAVHRTFQADPVAPNVLTGGLWTNEVPEDVDPPFGFVELLGSRYQWTTEDFHVETATVCVHVYALGGENCEAAMRALRQCFDWRELQFDTPGSSTVQVMPTDSTVQSEFSRHAGGAVVYQARTNYEIMINRTTLRG